MADMTAMPTGIPYFTRDIQDFRARLGNPDLPPQDALEHHALADAQYNLTGRATSLLTGLSSYFEKASHTPTGKRIVDFYTAHSKQVQDIHAEARRLADLKKEEAGGDPLKASGLNKVPGLERVLNALTHNNNAQPAAQEAQPAAATA